ncbi:uncharacterized protein CEXT_250821 [Caerostris extrusa]|uniref:Uncharacterized protein n=1 Tax=Caerostris extrusa TaxID=172846 RepID=A0AAV4TEK9_CAEEX|nr:uncharacterized protein CEXT_250821 [Caerostris extrusa]
MRQPRPLTVEAPFRVISFSGCGKEKFSLHGKLPTNSIGLYPDPLSLTSRPDAPREADQSRSFAAEFLKRKFKLSVGRSSARPNERRLPDRLLSRIFKNLTLH